jgi:single-strand DNA-binding protein
MTKGAPVLVEGRLKTNEWEDKNTGEKRSRIELQAERVQRLDWSQTKTSGGTQEPAESDEPPSGQDDIPF